MRSVSYKRTWSAPMVHQRACRRFRTPRGEPHTPTNVKANAVSTAAHKAKTQRRLTSTDAQRRQANGKGERRVQNRGASELCVAPTVGDTLLYALLSGTHLRLAIRHARPRRQDASGPASHPSTAAPYQVGCPARRPSLASQPAHFAHLADFSSGSLPRPPSLSLRGSPGLNVNTAGPHAP